VQDHHFALRIAEDEHVTVAEVGFFDCFFESHGAFGNRLVQMDVKGSVLQAALENGVSQIGSFELREPLSAESLQFFRIIEATDGDELRYRLEMQQA